MRRPAALVLTIGLAACAVEARAQGARPAPSAPQAPAAMLAPYEPQLVRLAEIMGALHLIRRLCGGPEAGAWRREMQALIDAEATSPERRERLTQSFNRGYAGFEQTHRSCTASARLASRRYLDEGRRILADITSRYQR